MTTYNCLRRRVMTATTCLLVAVLFSSAQADAQPPSGVTITTLIPSSVGSGTESLILVVRGTGFTRGSQIRLDGHQSETTFTSATELRTQLSTSDLASAKSLKVSVFTPGHGSTSPLSLRIIGAAILAPDPHDHKAPTLVMPSDISIVPPTNTAPVVTYTVSATDNSGSAIVTCVPPSGSTFAFGTTPVKCVARDPSGNTTDGTFNVTVVIPPPSL
jgi:HYR domain